MEKQLIRLLSLSVVFLALALQSCDVGANHGRHSKNKRHGRVYTDENQKKYVRSYDDGQFWYWMYMAPDTSSSTSVTSRSSSLTSGNWIRVSNPPSNLTATSKVVTEENGKPTEEIQEETEVANEDVVTEETSIEQEQAFEANESSMDSDATDGSDASDSGSDSGGDSGGDGGDDGGD